jgi:hypothetical protein
MSSFFVGRVCPSCGEIFQPVNARQKHCRPSCAHAGPVALPLLDEERASNGRSELEALRARLVRGDERGGGEAIFLGPAPRFTATESKAQNQGFPCFRPNQPGNPTASGSDVVGASISGRDLPAGTPGYGAAGHLAPIRAGSEDWGNQTGISQGANRWGAAHARVGRKKRSTGRRRVPRRLSDVVRDLVARVRGIEQAIRDLQSRGNG